MYKVVVVVMLTVDVIKTHVNEVAGVTDKDAVESLTKN